FPAGKKRKKKTNNDVFWASFPLIIKKKSGDIHYHLPPNESPICPEKIKV
ncbi:unnamed protein product, partial [Staurois parvus]